MCATFLVRNQDRPPEPAALGLVDPHPGEGQSQERRSRHRDAVARRASPLTGELVENVPVVVQRDVGELWAAVDVADREDTGRRRTQLLVDLDEASIVGGDAGRAEVEVRGGRAATGRVRWSTTG
jgi:hypothetical protein